MRYNLGASDFGHKNTTDQTPARLGYDSHELGRIQTEIELRAHRSHAPLASRAPTCCLITAGKKKTQNFLIRTFEYEKAFWWFLRKECCLFSCAGTRETKKILKIWLIWKDSHAHVRTFLIKPRARGARHSSSCLRNACARGSEDPFLAYKRIDEHLHPICCSIDSSLFQSPGLFRCGATSRCTQLICAFY